jgi:hypothetical protein
MLQRNLLYTGITRGKWLVVLVGQKKAVAIAVAQHLGPAAVVEAAGVAGIRKVCQLRSERSGTMNSRKAYKIWIEQCEAGQTIRASFGLYAAFDYSWVRKLCILSKPRPKIANSLATTRSSMLHCREHAPFSTNPRPAHHAHKHFR